MLLTSKQFERCRRALQLTCLLLAAWSSTRAELLPAKSYTTADGLARDAVTRILLDSRGFLWFGTVEGLSRFDGYVFTNYTTAQGLPHPLVTDLLETREGVYWVATGDGVCRFDPTRPPAASTDAPLFTVFRTGADQPSRFTKVLFEDHTGAVWAGTRGGVYRLGPEAHDAFQLVDIGLSPDNADGHDVNAIGEDRAGTLWVGTEGSGLHRRWPDGHVDHFNVSQGLPTNNIRALLEDREGRMWVGTYNGLCLLVTDPDPSRSVVARLYTTKDGLPNNEIRSLLETSDGRLWVGIYGGLSEFVSQDASPSFRSYTTAQGLSDVGVNALAEDPNGNLWLGTENSGAMKLTWKGFTTYTKQDGLADTHVSSIFADGQGALRVVTNFIDRWNINLFDGQRFKAVRPDVPESVKYFGWGWNQITVQDRAGEWWIPTATGLYRFPRVESVEQLARTRPRAFYTQRDGLSGDEIFRLFEDSRGDIWIGTMRSTPAALTRWERATETFNTYGPDKGLPDVPPSSFVEDSAGELWVGLYGGGLARLRGGRFTLFSVDDGVPAGMIRALYLDAQGRLWIASGRGGLGRVDDPTAEQPRFAAYTIGEGLSSNDVWSLTGDQWGRIYAGTGRGVNRLDPATGHVEHFTTADGLARGQVEIAFRDPKGVLWFGTPEGLSRLVPEPDTPQPPPPVRISGLRIAGVTQPVSALGEVEVAPRTLEPDQNQVEIDFIGLSFGAGEVLRYQYKLEGADRDWSAPTGERTVNYARLAPGTYRFLVRAMSAEGLLSLSPASFSFTVRRPVWQRWWFITLAAVSVALFIGFINRQRTARLIELERVRTRIATDLHDDIGSSLSQVAVLSEIIRRRVAPDPQVAEPLTMIAGLSRDLLDGMSDIVWAINPKRDRLSDLAQRMRRFASDVFTAREIEFTFDARDPSSDLKLGAEVRREVFLIFKEGVNNIARHSGCRAAGIKFQVAGGTLELTLRDDGRGFDTTHADEGNGLDSMRQRAAKLGGTLSIESEVGAGTTVSLRVPVGRRGLRWPWSNGSSRNGQG